MNIKNLLLSLSIMVFLSSACGDKNHKQAIQKETPKEEIVKLDTLEEEPAQNRTEEVVEPEWPKTIIVQEGDWIFEISRREYGSVYEWKKIVEANKEIISDPNLIYPGMQLILPE